MEAETNLAKEGFKSVKSAQRHDRKAGRVYGLRAEAFFCLDFLVTFVSRQK